mmetsp:Transcript_20155/g.64915  ORF Transcript_20155/g.64915 Transcript_20155/m.64915 type:complete len:315 (+) Transcript_20155:61-1005(+)
MPKIAYRCRQCRYGLFESEKLEAHSRLSSRQCTSLFLEEPEDWMALVGTSGKLACPKCEAKVGAFDWSGIRCACGAWVAPGFQFAKSRLDERRRENERGGGERRISSLSLSRGDDAAKAAGVAIHWLRSRPPPCVVVVCGEDARRAIETRWAGRHVKDGRAAWLFVGLDGIGHLGALIDHLLRDCGVAEDRLAVGGIGRRAAKDTLKQRPKVAAFFALAVEPDDLASLFRGEVPHDLDLDLDRPALAVVAGESRRPESRGRAESRGAEPSSSSFLTVAAFPRLEPGTVDDGVVRTLCTWLCDTLPGCGILTPRE